MARKAALLTLTLALVLCFAGAAWATNGYQMIGVGQNEVSMAGAVTANPLDAMTAITNPAGMARVGKRADFSMEAFMPVRSINFTANGGNKNEGGAEMYGIPSLGWTAPAFGREDVYFGGGMYVTSGLGVDYDETVYMPGAALGLPKDVTFGGYSAIQFWKMAPTVAWNVDDKLSLGFALNLDYQSVTIDQKFRNVPFWNNPMDKTAGMTQRDIIFDLGRPTSQFGYGFTMGALYDPAKWLTLGAMYSSKQNFEEAEYRVGTNDILNYSGAVGKPGVYRMDMEYPQQAAVGAAVKPMDGVVIDMDVKWIDWSSTHDKVKFTGPADSFDSDGDGVGDSNKIDLNFGWDDQWVYAIGMGVDATKDLTLRAGYNYGESPIGEEDVFNNLVFPAIVEKHYTAGFDYKLGKSWGISMAYMKAVRKELAGKNDVSSGMQQVTPFGANSGAKIALEEDSVGMQLSYRF